MKMKQNHTHFYGVYCSPYSETRACFNIKTIFPGRGNYIIKIRRSWDRLIFIMGFLHRETASVLKWPAVCTPTGMRLTAKCMFNYTILPQLTLPKMVCLLCKLGAGPKVKKNWLPLSWGPALAMHTSPRRTKRKREWNSSWKQDGTSWILHLFHL